MGQVRFSENSFLDDDITSFMRDFHSETDTVVCHTSGSTGTPKEIRVNKSAMLYSARNTVTYFGLDENSKGLLCLPAKYIAGRMMLVRAYVSGMLLYSVPPALNPLKGLINAKFDFAAFTPAQVLEIISDKETALLFASIKHVIIGGAAIDNELENQLLAFPNAIFATYGMTETVSHIALRKVGEKTYRKISEETLLGIDSENCLWIEDKNYVTEKLQTNDVVDLAVNAREFEWLGRRDFVINSGGVKLHPEQLEEKIKFIEAWKHLHFFISKKQDVRFGERPLLVIEKGQKLPDLETLSSRLSSVEMPSGTVWVERFVYTQSGKLNRLATLAAIK